MCRNGPIYPRFTHTKPLFTLPVVQRCVSPGPTRGKGFRKIGAAGECVSGVLVLCEHAVAHIEEDDGNRKFHEEKKQPEKRPDQGEENAQGNGPPDDQENNAEQFG